MKTSELTERLKEFLTEKLLVTDVDSVTRWTIRLGLETVPFYAKKMLAQHKESLEALCIYRAKDDSFDRDTLKNLLDEIMDKEKSLTVKFGGHSFTFEQSDLDELFMGLN